MILPTSSIKNLKNKFFLLFLLSALNVERSHSMEEKEVGGEKIAQSSLVIREKRQEIVPSEDLTRDLILSPTPHQDNPYLYKITLNTYPKYLSRIETALRKGQKKILSEEKKEIILKKDKKEIYLLLSHHTFPIDLVMPRKKLDGIIKKCLTFVVEISANSSTEINDSSLAKDPYETGKHYGFLLSEEEKKQGMKNWFSDLNPDAQDFIKKSVGESVSTNLDLNELHPKAVHWAIIMNSALSPRYNLVREELDESLLEIFLKNKRRDHVLSLENDDDRTEGDLQHLKKIESETKEHYIFLFNNFNEIFANFNTSVNNNIKEQILSEGDISYYEGKGEIQKPDPTKISLIHRDNVWKPRYLKMISNLRKSYADHRLFMVFGLNHGYNFFKTIQNKPGLAQSISRYSNETGGWVQNNPI